MDAFCDDDDYDDDDGEDDDGEDEMATLQTHRLAQTTIVSGSKDKTIRPSPPP